MDDEYLKGVCTLLLSPPPAPGIIRSMEPKDTRAFAEAVLRLLDERQTYVPDREGVESLVRVLRGLENQDDPVGGAMNASADMIEHLMDLRCPPCDHPPASDLTHALTVLLDERGTLKADVERLRKAEDTLAAMLHTKQVKMAALMDVYTEAGYHAEVCDSMADTPDVLLSTLAKARSVMDPPHVTNSDQGKARPDFIGEEE